MEKSIKDKTVLVTGGTAGIGLAIGEKFLENSAKLLIIVDINEQQGIEATTKIRSKYGEGKAVFYKCDITSDLEDIFKKVIDVHQYVDVLINNAGVLNEKSVRKTLDVNTVALMEWTVKFHDHMRKDKGGKGGTIINISSIYGYRTFPFLPYYHASKHAVIGFSKSIGHEYNFKRSGVRVITLCPGFTYTALVQKPSVWDDETLSDVMVEFQKSEWQEADVVGSGVIEIFGKADSGTVWEVEGSRAPRIIQ